MMSAFVDKGISIAVDISNAVYKYARREATFEEVAAARNVLRTHLEAHEAVMAQLAEALRKTKTCGLATEVRDVVNQALKAYGE